MVLIVASGSVVDMMAVWRSAHKAERVLLMTFNWSENRIGIPSVGCTLAMGLSMLKFMGMVDILSIRQHGTAEMTSLMLLLVM
jgi:hypothetical protein